MYDFLDSGFKRRAFKKALKEVKDEGYYINVNEGMISTASVDMGSDIAELSNRTIANKLFPKEETYDVTGLAPNLDTEYIEESVEEEPDLQEVSKEQYFADTTFVSGKNKEDEDLLSRKTEDKEFIEKSEDQIEYEKERFRKTFIANLEKQLDEKKEKNKQVEVVKEPIVEEDVVTPQEEVVVEEIKEVAPVVIPEPKVEKVESAPVVEPKTHPKKRTYTKRKRKKYDADIIGGFDY